ncbi:MAG: multiheme c-type cytochrome, partial [Candidatus Methylacidiphilales bacterium]
YHTWKESGHAHAFDSLVARDSDADPNCIACHTVGFGTASGYRRVFAGNKLTHVGCESCHGPGSVHVEQRTSGLEPTFRFRPLGPADCQQCHFGEFSRPFDWDTFWPHIMHGKEPPQPSAQDVHQEEVIAWIQQITQGQKD